MLLAIEEKCGQWLQRRDEYIEGGFVASAAVDIDYAKEGFLTLCVETA